MKKGYSLAIMALLGYISSADAYKLQTSTESKLKTRDWDDLLGDQSVFNEKGYSNDTPDGYNDVVNDVVNEKEQALESRR